ncbi:MAG: hypothetical protein TH68_02195 [Candidatus Synechococcus spongiarum 142]|uniref:N-(5'-phosphoribosyl)anthranilate isomerase n=1 Tax=Candidatus Synechococcus spongiarum 142 TaxID=1608213 RepID=A0A6N3X625_9SYNE|nr:MAG: hypothetical protein TH68_02195 [Candidatus Synechococcus spongiarum 142]
MGSSVPVQIKICGLTTPQQAQAVVACGVEAIGVIAVAGSPRWVPPTISQAIWTAVQEQDASVARVLVVADGDDVHLDAYLGAQDSRQRPTTLQLHGKEQPERCRQLVQRWGLPIWKAHRIRNPEDLQTAQQRQDGAAARLFDAHVPQQWGGTGQRLPVHWFCGQRFSHPWWLAGGLGPENVAATLQQLAAMNVRPDGVDTSSRLEHVPGQKDLGRCADFVAAVRGAGV